MVYVQRGRSDSLGSGEYDVFQTDGALQYVVYDELGRLAPRAPTTIHKHEQALHPAVDFPH